MAVILAIGTTLPVFADPANPDDVQIPTIYVNRGLLEDDDFLLVAYYDVAYAVLPADPIDTNFVFRLIDTDGTTVLGNVLAYPYNDLGYGCGIVSFYFDATSAPTWGQNYKIRISGNPAVFATPPTYEFVVGTGDYTGLAGTDTEGNQTQLANRLLGLVQDLENEWSITLTSEQDTGTVLSGNGENYIRNAILGSQAMAPSIFFLQSAEVDTSSRVWGTSLHDTYQHRLDAWSMGTDALQGVADELNIPFILLIGVIVMGVCVFVIYKSQQKFGNAMPGVAASLMVLICGGMLYLGMTLIGLTAFALIVTGSYFLFFRKA